MKKETVFQRYEFKYLLTRGQQARLLSAAGARLRPDEYSHSSIRNLYLTLRISGSSAGAWKSPSTRKSCVCAAMAGRTGNTPFLWS